MTSHDDAGRKTGLWEEADSHGGMIFGDYNADKREGVWRHLFADGALRSESHYEGGALNGDCVWYRQTGGLLQKGAFRHDEKHGLWQRWTKTGALIDEGEFDRGTKSGTWTYYNADGSVKKTTNHRGRA